MDTVVHFDTQLLNLLAGVVIPILVGVFTKLRSSAAVKSAVMLGLSLISALITTAIGEPEGGWPLYDLLYSLGQTVLASGVFYTNVWKPTGVIPTVAEKTAAFGIGAEVIPPGTTTQDPVLSDDPENPDTQGIK